MTVILDNEYLPEGLTEEYFEENPDFDPYRDKYPQVAVFGKPFYNQIILGDGGAIELDSGTLPDGLTLDSGIISGIPNKNYNIENELIIFNQHETINSEVHSVPVEWSFTLRSGEAGAGGAGGWFVENGFTYADDTDNVDENYKSKRFFTKNTAVSKDGKITVSFVNEQIVNSPAAFTKEVNVYEYNEITESYDWKQELISNFDSTNFYEVRLQISGDASIIIALMISSTISENKLLTFQYNSGTDVYDKIQDVSISSFITTSIDPAYPTILSDSGDKYGFMFLNSLRLRLAILELGPGGFSLFQDIDIAPYSDVWSDLSLVYYLRCDSEMNTIIISTEPNLKMITLNAGTYSVGNAPYSTFDWELGEMPDMIDNGWWWTQERIIDISPDGNKIITIVPIWLETHWATDVITLINVNDVWSENVLRLTDINIGTLDYSYDIVNITADGRSHMNTFIDNDHIVLCGRYSSYQLFNYDVVNDEWILIQNYSFNNSQHTYDDPLVSPVPGEDFHAKETNYETMIETLYSFSALDGRFLFCRDGQLVNNGTDGFIDSIDNETPTSNIFVSSFFNTSKDVEVRSDLLRFTDFTYSTNWEANYQIRKSIYTPIVTKSYDSETIRLHSHEQCIINENGEEFGTSRYSNNNLYLDMYKRNVNDGYDLYQSILLKENMDYHERMPNGDQYDRYADPPLQLVSTKFDYPFDITMNYDATIITMTSFHEDYIYIWTKNNGVWSLSQSINEPLMVTAKVSGNGKKLIASGIQFIETPTYGAVFDHVLISYVFTNGQFIESDRLEFPYFVDSPEGLFPFTPEQNSYFITDSTTIASLKASLEADPDSFYVPMHQGYGKLMFSSFLSISMDHKGRMIQFNTNVGKHPIYAETYDDRNDGTIEQYYTSNHYARVTDDGEIQYLGLRQSYFLGHYDGYINYPHTQDYSFGGDNFYEVSSISGNGGKMSFVEAITYSDSFTYSTKDNAQDIYNWTMLQTRSSNTDNSLTHDAHFLVGPNYHWSKETLYIQLEYGDQGSNWYDNYYPNGLSFRIEIPVSTLMAAAGQSGTMTSPELWQMQTWLSPNGRVILVRCAIHDDPYDPNQIPGQFLFAIDLADFKELREAGGGTVVVTEDYTLRVYQDWTPYADSVFSTSDNSQTKIYVKNPIVDEKFQEIKTNLCCLTEADSESEDISMNKEYVEYEHSHPEFREKFETEITLTPHELEKLQEKVRLIEKEEIITEESKFKPIDKSNLCGCGDD